MEGGTFRAREAGFTWKLSVALALGVIYVLAAQPVAGQEPVPDGRPSDRDRMAELRDRIDEYASALADGGGLSGTVLVAVNHRAVYERAFGLASRELGIANTVATRHGIASVTKLLTAILTLSLVEDGVLGLDDPLSDFVSDFPRSDEITVEHLLRHRSGIHHRVTADGDVTTRRTAADMVDLARGSDLLFAPGSDRAYSSAGYSVLARVLEVATGRSFGDLMRTEVFGPAGALHSVTDDGWSLIPGRSDDYLLGATGPMPARPANLSFLVGAGSVFSTPADLLAVLETLVEGGYGDLARSELLDEEGDLSWNGQSFGYRAFIDYRSEGGRAVIFAGNLHTGAPDLLRRDLPRILAGEDVGPPSPPDPEPALWSPESRTELEGVYQFRAGQPDSEESLRFSPDGRQATLGSWILVPVAARELFSTTDYATLTVVHDERGGIRGLEWRKGDSSFFLPRAAGPESEPGGGS
jgi:CubicO group peptidase (beta-lactamase class C family)